MNKKVLIFAGAALAGIGAVVAYKLIKKNKENAMSGKHEIKFEEYHNSDNVKKVILYFDDDEEFASVISTGPHHYQHLSIEESIDLIGEEAYDHCLACSENRTKEMPRFIFVRDYDKEIDYKIVLSRNSYKIWMNSF